MGMRMTGLISGMDTESMVKELVSASSTKVDKVKKEKQILQWKQEAWQGLNTKLYNFFKTEVSSLRLATSFKAKKATSNDETKVTVKAGSASASGSHRVSVKQLASSAYLTGANIKARGNNYTTYAEASANTKFEDMTDEFGTNLGLKGQTITIKAGNDTIGDLTFELGGTGDNGVASLEELNKKLAATTGYEKLSASFSEGKLTFTNASATKNEDGVTVGEIYTIEGSVFGITGDVGYESDEASGKKNTLGGTTDLRYRKDFTSDDITKYTKLADVGINVGTSFTINGKDFVVDKDTTITDFTEGLSKLGVSASFDDKQGRFYINSAETGEEYNFDLTSSDSNALDILGLSTAAGATKVEAQNAIIDYNGVEYIGSSNTFELNGLTITARGVTGTYDKATGKLTNDTPINIEVEADVDGMYDTIKNFVKKYNELIDEMNTLYNEKKAEYEPLTEDEKSQLSDTEIEKWEKKAKVGLLRRDDTINSLLSSMRTILNKAITVTDKDGNEKTYTLAALGIVTGDYTENGKLHIMGDEDDAEYAAEENKLKAALSANPEIFSQVFVGDKENPGIGTQLYSSLQTAMKRTENSRSLTFYNDITLEEQIDDKDDEIDKWEEKLQALEDKYYDQFTAMEKAMAELQQQQSYLAQLMGTA
ncbi:MAG: flagellar filament capping protein FliD [Clostridium sp.]|nr:flagellar filament capping protein FliD [Clostridium sp.]MCM1458759.1 flagellar filament capping protein FliD [Bacteroides sp.]